jgi:hypothetical protein
MASEHASSFGSQLRKHHGTGLLQPSLGDKRDISSGIAVHVLTAGCLACRAPLLQLVRRAGQCGCVGYAIGFLGCCARRLGCFVDASDKHTQADVYLVLQQARRTMPPAKQ